MRRLVVFFLFILSVNISFAQAVQNKENLKTADKLFDNNQFKNALDFYRSALKEKENDPYLCFRIGECYRKLFQYTDARLHYKKASAIDSLNFPLATFYEALMFKLNGEYQEALEKFQKFEQLAANVQFENMQDFIIQTDVEKRGCLFAIEQSAAPYRDFKIAKIEGVVNSIQNDYSTVLLENDSLIIISSGRNSSNKIDERLAEPYSDHLRFKKEEAGWTAYTSADGFEAINTKYGEGAGVVNSDKSKFYFTRCGGDESNCVIVYSELKNGKWQKPVKLNNNINQAGTDSKHPALSNGGDTLIFVSDRAGGFGMNDLWMSIRQQDENWGTAINCGKIINTPFNEISPSFSRNENYLTFSSEGHHSLGGFDIFIYKGNDFSNEKQLVNPGLPFNSNMDDCYFVLGEKHGYLSSNRESSVKKFDIFTFNIEEKEEVIASISNNKALAWRELYKKHEQNVFYENASSQMIARTDDESTPDDKASRIAVAGRLSYADSNHPASQVTIPLVDKEGNIVKYTTTNENGNFRYSDIAANQDYRILADEKSSSFLSNSAYKVTSLEIVEKEGRAPNADNETIYFDFDKSSLRSEARKVLDELIAYSKQNPDMQIEINAFTDIVGNDQYNISLSEKRGEATFKYLVDNSMDRTALVRNAFGKKYPVAPNDNLYGRQLNRRVELILKGVSDDIRPVAETYILQPKATLYSIAQAYGMSVEELKQINGLTSDKIEAFRPLRVINRTEKKAFRMLYSSLDPGEFHIVQKGETIFSISKLYKMSPKEVKELNMLQNDQIFEGQQIKIKQGQEGISKY